MPRTREERATGPARVARRAPGTRCGLLREVLGFAAAGLCAYLADLALFVWLRGAVGLGPLAAKALSFTAACGIAYAGNALGPYRGRVHSGSGPGPGPGTAPGSGPGPGSGPASGAGLGSGAGSGLRWAPFRLRRYRHFARFAAINLAGAVVQLLCLAVTHYGLGLTSPWADTVSGAGVGMALATVLRFWAARTFVFGANAAARGLVGRVS